MNGMSVVEYEYDVIVVGAGHAGTEAALESLVRTGSAGTLLAVALTSPEVMSS